MCNLKQLISINIQMDLKNYIREIADFPKPGIIFKDITPLLLNHAVSNTCLNDLISGIKNAQVDKVIGIESRGFIFGMALAQQLHAGFIPVRKPKKLPFHTISASYQLEYGVDQLEIHSDAIQKGDKILIHDDVLATGGTAQAVAELVTKLGGEIVQFNFLIELSFLNGRDKIKEFEVYTAMTY
jgi:adenine phosphoribosyltransferase